MSRCVNLCFERFGGLLATSPPIGQALPFNPLHHAAHAFGIFDAHGRAVRVAKIELGKVAMNVLFAAVLVDAVHAALEDREEAFNGVRRDTLDAQTRSDLEKIKANDIAILDDGSTADGIIRFHNALSLMTMRRGVRNEISPYEAMALALVEPRGDQAGSTIASFPPDDSLLRVERFSSTLYARYDERFVYGAPALADRGITPRLEWAPASPVFAPRMLDAASWPVLDFEPRLAAR